MLMQHGSPRTADDARRTLARLGAQVNRKRAGLIFTYCITSLQLPSCPCPQTSATHTATLATEDTGGQGAPRSCTMMQVATDATCKYYQPPCRSRAPLARACTKCRERRRGHVSTYPRILTNILIHMGRAACSGCCPSAPCPPRCG